MQRWKRLNRWLKRQFTSQGLILMYHRVTDLSNDPHLLAVTSEHFVEQMEVIRQCASPIRLQELVEALRAGKVPRRSVVITFDDGYADNLYEAKPLLERYEIPSTVFVAAGQVGSKREFWWDELDRILLQPGTVPEKLQVRLNGSTNEWFLDGAATYTEEKSRQDRSWHIERKDDPSPRQSLFRNLFDQLQFLPVRERQNVLDDLAVWAGVERTGRPTHRTLTSDELILLGKDRLVEVGAHTLTHPRLSTLPVEEQHDEIQKGRECLEAILNHPVTSFAYPNGSSTPETIEILKDLGFLCACSSDPDTVGRSVNRFRLPRVVVRDWDGEMFSRWLRWWIGG